MFSGNGRWYRLAFLALCNLALWVAIAALAGLLVSDQVDLGLETQLRQAQATAVAAWNRLPEGEPVLPGRSTPLASVPRPTATQSGSRQTWPTPGVTPSGPGPSSAETLATGAPTTGGPDGAGGAAGNPGSAESATAQPAPGSHGTATAAGEGVAASGQGIATGVIQPTPEPTQALLTKPLLLADPEFHDLAGLNAEMARSVPGRIVQIRYQEAALNREINLLCENNPDLPFSNVRADLKRDQVVLTGEMTVLGFQVEARVTGTVIVRDCRPQIEIQNIAVAGVLTPQFVRDQIEQQVLEAMAWYPADYPLCLEQIVLEETRATIYGYHR